MDADFILSPYLRSNNNIIYLTFLSIRYFRTILHYPAAKTSWVALCNHGGDRCQKDKKEKQTEVLKPRNV